MKFIVTFLVLVPLALAAGEGELTWQDCARQAAGNHPDLRSAREKVEQARADAGLVRSPYLPQISATASVNRTAKSPVTSTASSYSALSGSTQALYYQYYQNNSSAFTIIDTWTLGLSGRQVIFDGLKTLFDMRAAGTRVHDAACQYAISSMDVRYNLRVAYVQLLKAQEAVGISREIVTRRKKNRELVRQRYQAGREHKGSLLNAEASLAEAEYSVRLAERAVIMAQRNLQTQMGMAEPRALRVRGSLDDAAAEHRRPDFTLLVSTHPAWRQALYRTEAARYAVQSKQAAFSPVISATGSVNRSDTRFPPGKTNWSAGIEISVPILEGGRTVNDLAKADAALRQARADTESARNRLVTVMEQRWTDWQNAYDLADVQRQYLRAAEERAKIAEAQYGIGLILFDMWVIIENDLARLKLGYLDARAAALAAEAQWIQSKGETLDYDR